HVIYIIKENRTYDQLFGDMKEADSDPSLLFFGRDITPNHHAMAERFGLFDRFFVNAGVSAQGHNWSTAAYVNDYVSKTVPTVYGGKGRTYDYEGTNRGKLLDDDEDDVASPSTGYLWDLAIRKGISFRDYGEFTLGAEELGESGPYLPTKKSLAGRVDEDYPGFGVNVSDQTRTDRWMREFEG